MTQVTEKNKRIAKNTLLLYFRMLFTMAVSLYTSRVVLNTLGIEDFGIYNVVGGVVAMFAIISSSLSAAISRFITFELGRNNLEKLKVIFSSAVIIQIILALVISLFSELIGVWFLNNKMNIPIERIVAANWVLQCSILTFVVNLISVPYNAAIIAHEHMKAFAYVSILEVSLKLAIVFLLYTSSFDKLITYAVLLLLVAIIIRFIYGFYCKRKFEECTCHFIYNKEILTEMLGFAGWNFIGTSSAVLRDQGVNIVINIFCGPVVNAARAISFQVNTAIQGFVTNFMTALNPQITKSYASGDRGYMMTLLYQGSRLAFYMLFFFSLPVIIEADSILLLWLKIVPEHTVNFVRLVLVFAMSESISGPLITAMLATGRIRNYQILVGGLQMLNFPISYFLLRWGGCPEITIIVAIIISQCCLIARLWMLRGMIGLSSKQYLKKVYLNILMVSILSAIFPVFIYSQMPIGYIRFITVIGTSFVCCILVVFYVGCSHSERLFVIQKIQEIKYKLGIRK